jgi:pilus assembly protein CpaB
MNLKTVIPLVLAIGLGLAAALVAKNMLNQQKKPVQQGNMAQVVLTKRPLAPGAEISADDLTLGEVPAEAKPEGGFTSVSELLGRTVKVEMVRNQAVVEPLLAERGAGSGLQALVPAGMRAITIEVNEFSGVAGMVAPGCRVDVVATIQASNNEELSSHTIVQNVSVTAVGQRVTARPDPKDDPQQQQQAFRSVTLLCTPEEAEAIQLANTNGRPWLVLRGNKDDEKVETAGITLTGLRGSKMKNDAPTGGKTDPFVPVSDIKSFAPTTRPTAPTPIVMNTRTVQVIRGGTESSVTITLPTVQGGDVTGAKDPNDEE